jgi:hypothetical protein
VLYDWSSGGHAGLAPTVQSRCTLACELWALGLQQVCVGCVLGSPIGQRLAKSLAGLEVSLVLELWQWVAPWRSGLEVRVWVFDSSGLRLGAFLSGSLVT